MGLNLFVSYSARDKKIVIPVVRQLRNVRNFAVVSSNLNSSELVKQERIAQALMKCDLFLIFHTISARRANSVRQHFNIAKASSRRITPILLDRTKPDSGLLESNYIDFSSSRKILNFITSYYKNQKQQEFAGVYNLVALALVYIAEERKKYCKNRAKTLMQQSFRTPPYRNKNLNCRDQYISKLMKIVSQIPAIQ